jgi:hypothetical protein
MTTPTLPHRTRGHGPGYRVPLTDITICIQPTPGVEPEVWRALYIDVNAAIDASPEKHGLSAVRNGDGHRPLGPGSKKWDIPL